MQSAVLGGHSRESRELVFSSIRANKANGDTSKCVVDPLVCFGILRQTVYITLATRMEDSEIHVGATFSSFEEFSKVFKDYCTRTHQRFVVGGSSKVDTFNGRMKLLSEAEHNNDKPLYAEQLMYKYVLYRCIRQGSHKSTSKGLRKTTSYRNGCEAHMYLKGNRMKGCLEILRLATEHNHPIGPDVSYRKTSRIRKQKKVGSPKKKNNLIVGPVADAQNNKAVGHSIGVNELQAAVKEIIPPLTCNLQKGQAGRIGIIGGCQEYTGAPYFAAISALKVGGDLSHIFCTKDAGTVIKCYSPELIVLPILDHPTASAEFDKWLPKLHTLVVGPGLGRDQQVMETVAAVILKAKSRGIPLVIDADGLFLITETPELITNYQHTLLTPNVTEFQKLFEKMVGDRPCQTDEPSNVKLLAQCLGNVTILRKGNEDIISDGSTVIMCSTEGSPRRCGGQGDLLAGATSVFFNWALSYHNSKTKLNQQVPDASLGPGVLAAFMACRLTRECSRLAFAIHGRSMTATDMLVNIHAAFEGVFLK